MHDQTGWRFRPYHLVVGLICFAWIWGWFEILDRRLLRGAPDWVAFPYTASLLIAILGGVLFTGYGLGLLNTDVLAAHPSRPAPTMRQFVLVYLGSLIGIVGLSFATSALWDVHWMRTLLLASGAAFVLAPFDRPWWLFASLRRLGWFALIHDDRTMRHLLLVLGVLLLAVGALVPLGTFGEVSR